MRDFRLFSVRLLTEQVVNLLNSHPISRWGPCPSRPQALYGPQRAHPGGRDLSALEATPRISHAPRLKAGPHRGKPAPAKPGLRVPGVSVSTQALSLESSSPPYIALPRRRKARTRIHGSTSFSRAPTPVSYGPGPRRPWAAQSVCRRILLPIRSPAPLWPRPAPYLAASLLTS